jgi:hypothetical protein
MSFPTSVSRKLATAAVTEPFGTTQHILSRVDVEGEFSVEITDDMATIDKRKLTRATVSVRDLDGHGRNSATQTIKVDHDELIALRDAITEALELVENTTGAQS